MPRLLRLCLVVASCCLPLFGQGGVIGGSGKIGGNGVSGVGASSLPAFSTYNTVEQTAGCSGCAITLSTTTGHGLVACFGWQGSSTTLNSVTASETWTLLSATLVTDATNNYAWECADAVAGATGTDTITANFSGFTFESYFQAADYSGTAASSIIDTSSGLKSSGSTVSCPSMTTTVANDMVVCALFQYSGNSGNYTATSPFTLRGAANAITAWEDNVEASTGSVTPAFTTTNTGIWFAASIAIKP